MSDRATVQNRLAAALPATRHARIIALNALVGSVGTGLFLASSALYFTRFAGLTPIQLGIGMAVAGVVGFATTVPMGRLADRYGPRNMLLVVCLWRAIGYLAYLWVDGFTKFLVVASLLFVMDRAGQPLNQALVGRLITGTERNRTMGFIRALRNVGFTIGFSLAGIALTTGSAAAFRWLFIGNAVSFLFVFACLCLLPTVPPAGAAMTETADQSPAKAVPPIRDRRFVAVTAANGVLFLHDAVLITVLPLWVANHTRAPIWMITVLVTTNTVITVLLQVRLTRHVTDLASATRATTVSAVLLSVACAAFFLSGYATAATWAAIILMAALLLLTAAELLHSASSWEISFALAPEEAQGRYFAFFNLGFSAAEIAGPVVVLWLLSQAGAAGWLVLAGLFPLAAALGWVGTRTRHDPAVTPTPTPVSASSS
jgi:MFS family permease